MSLSYTIRESFSGFRRTKISSTLSVMTASVALLLLGLFTIVTIHAERFLEQLRSRVELEAFLFEPVTTITVDSLGMVIASFPEVDSVVYVSKSQAAEIFKREFGEDIMSVLDFNPLPPSLKVYLKDGFKTSGRVESFAARLRSLREIENVVYRKAILEVIDQRAATAHNITLALGVLVGLSAIILVSNTIRLAIYAKRKLIRTMELVGATRTFIRLPFLLEGVWQGLLGGGIAAVTLYLILTYGLKLLSTELAEYVRMEPVFYGLVIAAGGVLGLVGSLISVMRFIGPGTVR
jgi:cell division transport system permease protein